MKTLIYLYALILILIFPISGFSQSAFTLEEVMSYSFPSGLVVSETGDLAAWIQNKEGVRNVFVSKDGQAVTQVTSYNLDDGQAISNLIISPGNDFIVYVRGGAPNQNGEIPNPLSWPDKAKREIYICDLNKKTSVLIDEGASPSLSSNGNMLAYIKNRQVWEADLANKNQTKLFFSPRGAVNFLKWSPNDKNLAFVSNRSEHAFIGIFNLGTKTITYMDPSVDNDSDPAWSPDGKQVAFLRIPNEAELLPFVPQRSALSWSIHIADIESGKAKEIWKAKEGTGSAFRFVSSNNQIFWGAGNFIVFPWEGNGWTQLFSVKTDGTDLKPLSPGESEVQYVNISSDKKTIIFSSNKGDIDRQHIWKTDIALGKTEQVTDGEGIEWSPGISHSGQIWLLASGATLPAFPAILNEGNIKSLVPKSDRQNYPSDKLVAPEQVIFSAADGMKIHGQLFLPSHPEKGRKYPAVLFFHGGSRRQMLLGFHHSGYYHNAYAFNQYLANHGYIVLSVNYRSGIGYGMKFREALNYGARGASEFQDVLGAGLYLRNRSDVDPDRIGLWGGSYGGFLTAMGLAKASDLFTAGVDLHGVHDWNVVIKNFVSGYDPVKAEEAATLAYHSSPVAYIDTWKSPVLLIQGDDDRNVPFSETVNMAESLRKTNIYFEQLVFPDEVHGFLLHSNWVKAYKAAFDFFERKLKNK